tara:strand:- start:248 stop:490 length:243 start_codon:yes stop_codon:yes gene_type:complete
MADQYRIYRYTGIVKKLQYEFYANNPSGAKGVFTKRVKKYKKHDRLTGAWATYRLLRVVETEQTIKVSRPQRKREYERYY